MTLMAIQSFLTLIHRQLMSSHGQQTSLMMYVTRGFILTTNTPLVCI